MEMEQEFHEMFYVPDIKRSEKKRVKGKNRHHHNGAHHPRAEAAEGANSPLKVAKGATSGLKAEPLPASGSVPALQLNSNPSNFSVFSTIRQAVLEKRLKEAAILYNQTVEGLVVDESDDCDDEKSRSSSLMKVPKVVGMGLCVVFELIRESRLNNSSLCSRALHALLDALQGQLPEGLKREPPDVVDPLFELLLELASSSYQPPLSAEETPSSPDAPTMATLMKSFACSSLLSLVVARGDTGKMLTAVSALLTNPQSVQTLEEIETPNILISMQRSVHGVLLGKTARPEWLTHGFPVSSLCDSFPIQLKRENSANGSHFDNEKPSSLAFDGKYLYMLMDSTIYKIASGYGGTAKGQVVMSRRLTGTNKSGAGVGWIGSIKGYLYFQANNWLKNEMIKMDCESLKEVGKVTLGVTHWGPSASASDGDQLILITATKDDSFILRTLKPSTCAAPQQSHPQNQSNTSSSGSVTTSLSYLMPVVQELTLKLAHKCLAVCGGLGGGSLFEVSPVLEDDPQGRQYGFKPILFNDDEATQVCAGKDFAVIRTCSGRVFFTGKSQSLGMKQNGNHGKWTELTITKTPRIVNISVGHEGAHLLLVAEDGSVFFSGLAKRGEDGDQTKGRRQPKAVKPKKMIKLEGKHVVHSACNHGTSALVTKEGELYMFGKDSAHVDKNSGFVSGLKNVSISQVALGKAHTLALSNKGQVFTFGFNHKGQCGHDFVHSGYSSQQASSGASATAEKAGPVSGGTRAEEGCEQVADAQVDISEDVVEPLCASGNHRWKYEQCMICTSCGECTGYGPGCVASGKSEVRNPGMPCGCGAGDSGCTDCGICRACDSVSKEAGIEDNEGAAAAAASGPVNPLNQMVFAGMNALAQAEGAPVIMEGNAHRQVAGVVAAAAAVAAANDAVANNDHEYEEIGGLMRAVPKMEHVPAGIIERLQGMGRMDRRRIALDAHISRKFRHINRVYRNLGNDLAKGVGGNQQVDAMDRMAANVLNMDEQGAGSDCETTKLTSLPPSKLSLSQRVVQVAAGLHHSVLLTQSGEVFAFGSNQQGQLGLGDFVLREKPTKIPVNALIVQIAAGSNHTVLLSSQGQVFTFGNNQKGQLGRLPSAIDYNWNSSPGAVANIGPQNGRRATWIEACGDYTFVKLDESLINPLTLPSARVIANHKCIVIAPPNDAIGAAGDDRPFRSLVINRLDGTCKSYSSLEQLNLAAFSSLCLDNLYDVLWTFDSGYQVINRYNVIASEAKSLHQNTVGNRLCLPSILSPELSLPNKSSVSVSRSTAALNLLCALHTLTRAHQLGLQVHDDDQSKGQVAKAYSKDDFSSVNRFESHGGGWGYSGHSIEAIRFMCDTDILLGGFGLFGGRGEYMAKLRVYDIGLEGGEQEGDGDVLGETEEIPYECGARQKYPVLLEEPIHLQANRWYVAWARISGPSSDCGSSGQSVVNTEDQVTFYFKSSKKSNNGTDVNAGQIPLILYKLIASGSDLSSQGTSSPSGQCDLSVEPISILSRDFSMAVTPDCFHSLLKLLRWSWQSFKANLLEMSSAAAQTVDAILIDLKHLAYICCASLHLLKIYVNEVFPNNGSKKLLLSFDAIKLAECVGDTRTLMKLILSDPPPPPLPSGAKHTEDESEKYAQLLVKQIQSECRESFMACYHAFYPNTMLRWRGLCDLLLTLDVPWAESQTDNLLAAMLASLCNPLIRLTLTFPLYQSLDVFSVQSPTDLISPISSGVNGESSGAAQDPVLIEKMLEKSDKEGCHSGLECSFRDVLIKLLSIVGQPIECLLLKQDLKTPSNSSDEAIHMPLQSPNPPSTKLVENTCTLLSAVTSELLAQATGIGLDIQAPIGQTLHITPSRFSRVSQNRTWNTGNGSPDAICFSVDRPGILIAGVTVYGGIGNEWHYELEMLDYQGGGGSGAPDHERAGLDPTQSHQWCAIDMARGTYSVEEKAPDVAEVKFERPLPVRENVKYALRLRNHGARTNNGDGGLTHVRGPDGTTFTFSDCSLSFNGTNHTRGQIPQILYYSSPPSCRASHSNQSKLGDELQARRNTLSISEAIISLAVDLLLQAQDTDYELINAISSSHLVTDLLPSVLACLAPIATSDPKSATHVLTLIRQLLPLVSNLNKCIDYGEHCSAFSSPPPSPSLRSLVTTSRHYVIVESDHPYKPASVSIFKASFQPTVKWLSIEFDPRCGTSQPEDSVQIYIPSLGRSQHQTKQAINKPVLKEETNTNGYWPVFKRFSGRPLTSSWPSNALILPGNEVILSLETASDYVKDDKACYYGFRCQVVGYENPVGCYLGLQHLEQELAYLGATCVNSLLSRDLVLPSLPGESDFQENEVIKKFEDHSGLLGKGLSLAHPPSAQEALEGVLPLSHEKPFLKDFVYCTQGTSGGRLARWLQPESYADPNQCEVHCSFVSTSGPGTGSVGSQEVQCGWPTVITVITKDQYGKLVNVPNLKVEVCAQPFHTNTNSASDKSPKVTKVEDNENLALGGLPPPQTVPYGITVKDKMLYHAITMMSAFENYSFEELRYVAPVKKRNVEAMLVRSNSDGTYTANWTPGSAGWYQVKVVIDGVPISASQSVQVGETPKGLSLPQPPSSNASKPSQLKCQPSRTRRFVGRNSAGLRIRALPSLQSEQIGLLQINGAVTVVDEIQNDDGVWVRLSPESLRKHCSSSRDHQMNPGEAWCLQYNQQLGRTLLIPVEEEKPIINGTHEGFTGTHPTLKARYHRSKTSNTKQGFPSLYHVVKCGASGHNVRSRPTLKSPPVGMLVMGNVVPITQEQVNADGTWLKLGEDAKRRYCFNTDGDAWTLGITEGDVAYLQHEAEVMHIVGTDESDSEENKYTPVKKEEGIRSGPVAGHISEDKGKDAFSFPHLDGSFSNKEMSLATLSQSAASESEIDSISSSLGGGASITQSLALHTYTEHEKTETDSVNSSCTSNSSVATTGSRVAAFKKLLAETAATAVGSSPGKSKEVPSLGVSVKELVKALGSRDNSPTPPGTPSKFSPPPTPKQSSRSSSPGDSLIRRPSLQVSAPVAVKPSIPSRRRTTSSFSETTFSGISPEREKAPVKQMSQKSTQTSPPSETNIGLMSKGGHFTMGSDVPREPTSPKTGRSKEHRSSRQLRTKRERPHSPVLPSAQAIQPPVVGMRPSSIVPVKEAMSNSIAECLRAVFAAFIWHEGILHDAMAAASYLKFNPNLPKESLRSNQSQGLDQTKMRQTQASKGQKAKYRHSVEVSQLTSFQHECYVNANIELQKPISENETNSNDEKDGHNDNIIAAEQPLQDEIQEPGPEAELEQDQEQEQEFKQPDPSEQQTAEEGNEQLPSLDSTESDEKPERFPETLVHLLVLWEDISRCCLSAITQPPASVSTPVSESPATTPIQMFSRIMPTKGGQSEGLASEVRAPANPSWNPIYGRLKGIKGRYNAALVAKGVVAQVNMFGEAAALANGVAPVANGQFEHREQLTVCELCGNSYPYPVTHHMRRSHPGCGEHAGGKGYNSSGSFCGGWAGHCGDGGIGSSNWYLICDRCREKYLGQKKSNRLPNVLKAGNLRDIGDHIKLNAIKNVTSPMTAKSGTPVGSLEVHQIMKENALYLLRMSSASEPVSMSSSKEKQSQEFMCSASTFECLEAFGIQHTIYKQRLAEEHLTEDEIRAIQNGRPSSIIELDPSIRRPDHSNRSKEKQEKAANRSEFHRSVSIGMSDYPQERIVMMQRKRATSNDSTGSPLLCQPSCALTKLILMLEKHQQEQQLSAQCLRPSGSQQPSQQHRSGLRHQHSQEHQQLFALNRPILRFVLQQNDLVGLGTAIKYALRKVACRTYALQALNWLLRNVTQPMALHDLMWAFVSSLSVRLQEEKVDNEENVGIAAAVDRREADGDHHYHSHGGVCLHPVSDLTIAGEAVRPLQEAFHSFLQTVSDIMPLLPMGSPLQQIAMRCFCLHFEPPDHAFLHRSHVFSNISKILSRSEEEQGAAGGGNFEDSQPLPNSPQRQVHAAVEVLTDVTPNLEIKASSRQAMIGSLTDNSTETFWESGDEDRNKTKVITANCVAPDVKLRMVYVHVDNCRDLGSKISHVCFKCGETGSTEQQFVKLKSLDIENRFAGWLSCHLPLADKVKAIKIELKGPDNTLRLRQVKVLGVSGQKNKEAPKQVAGYAQIQQLNCEAETLRVFRLLTSQVFGRLISGGELDVAEGSKAGDSSGSQEQIPETVSANGDSNDLREHMVGILFSRSTKLSNLQKQVCAHIVSAIRVETLRVRDEWETLLCSKSTSTHGAIEIPSDAYCFEMLSMVLALSGSSIGRLYLAQQNDLLLDLFSLLHTGSARVQRQVTSLLRRVLPEIQPASLAYLLNVESLPPNDHINAASAKDVEFDVHKIGLLDVFLACIAKALTVQTKVKGSFGGAGKGVNTVTLATAIHPRDHLGSRWWLKGCMARKLAEVIIQLLKDMASGRLSETWASITKNAIAENIINLTRMPENYRSPNECVKTPTLWLGLASLCVLDQEHAERLSSSHWVASAAGDQANGNQPQQPARPFCDNHDDGETLAIILCNICGNLCADCDRFLHLHRKTKSHQRQIFKEEEEAIKVDLHEGCGRTKLFWLMALADSKTLKAMVEFRGETGRNKSSSIIGGGSGSGSAATGVCRFCGATGSSGLLAIGNVCGEAECQEHTKDACTKTLPCGHGCGGIKNEGQCLPCLHGCNGSTSGSGGELKQDADDMCMICFTEALSCAPAIQLRCGHVFHLHCSKAVISRRWPGPRISFGFALCPICKANIEHSILNDILKSIHLLFEDVKRKALMRLEYEGLHRSEAITTPGARFFEDPSGYAMERYAYYVCCKCEKAYYGGEARCDAEAGIGDDYDPNELVCGGCSDVSRAQMCPKHGTDFLEYKCRYCCSVAVFFCFGTTHFCNPCHDDFQRVTNIPKQELPHCPAGHRAKQLEGEECPLHVKHPPTGEEFALGCGVCRNAHTF